MGRNGEAFWRNLLPAKDLNDSSTLLDAEPVFIVVENIFCVYFVIELALRFGAFRYKRDCFKDAWFCFDSLLVALMVPWLGSSGMLLFFWNLQRHQHITIITLYHSILDLSKVFETWILTIVVVAWRKDIRHEWNRS